MVSKHSAVRSIRLQNDMWAWLAEEAARRETNVNGLVTDLLEVSRLNVAEVKAGLAAPAPSAKASKPRKVISRLKGEWKAP